MLMALLCNVMTIPIYGTSQNTQIEYDDISEEAYLKAQQCYEIYQNGVEVHEKGDLELAKNFFRDFLSIKNRPYIILDVELDLYVRLIAIANQENAFEDMCEYCAMAIAMPLDVLCQPTQLAWIYKSYIYALNMLDKCNEIDELIQKGQEYITLSHSPTEKEFYEILFQEVVSYLNRGNLDLAKSKLQIISDINSQYGGHIVDAEIESFQKHIIDYRDPFEDKQKFLDDILNYGLTFSTLGMLTMPEESSKAITSLFDTVNLYLYHTYFDILSVKDENYWTELICYYGAAVNGFCKGTNVIGREGLSYNYLLTRKNFLDYHSPRTHKKEINWKQIRASLESNEVAIEIEPYSREALILKESYVLPIAVEIDSIVLEEIKLYDSTDPESINSFYSSESPLCKIIRMLEPYFNDCETIYISGSYNLTQFNYGALSYRDSTIDQYYKIVQLLSTGDIPYYKNNYSKSPYENIILFGGVDFENTEDRIPITHSIDHQKPWAFHTDVPQELRKGYKYLPYSLSEVENISELCKHRNIKSSSYIGGKASEKAFIDLEIPQGSILHLSTHSYLLPSYKYDSLKEISERNLITRMGTVLSNTGLLFAGANKYLQSPYETQYDGILTASELAKKDLTNVKLTTLSSCSSALGDLSNVNGIVYGLASALKTAGVKQILVSLWDIHDFTTSILMTIFYENMFSGMDSRQALKMARSKLCEMGYSDPFYWASFVILD